MSRKRQGPKIYPHGKSGCQLTTLSYNFADGEDVEEHFHHEDQLVFASTGVMTVRTNEGVWVVPPQRAVWIPGKTIHAIHMSGKVSMRTLYFAANDIKGLSKKCFVMNVSPLMRELILHCCDLSGLATKNQKERRIIELIIDHLDSRHLTPLQLPLPTDQRARRVADLLISDPSDQKSLDDLCRECGASKRTVERLFQEETHLSMGRWRQQLRLLTSIERLAAGEKVTSVALEAGYNSSSAFISAFRKVLGTTPRLYSQSPL